MSDFDAADIACKDAIRFCDESQSSLDPETMDTNVNLYASDTNMRRRRTDTTRLCSASLSKDEPTVEPSKTGRLTMPLWWMAMREYLFGLHFASGTSRTERLQGRLMRNFFLLVLFGGALCGLYAYYTVHRVDTGVDSVMIFLDDEDYASILTVEPSSIGALAPGARDCLPMSQYPEAQPVLATRDTTYYSRTKHWQDALQNYSSAHNVNMVHSRMFARGEGLWRPDRPRLRPPLDMPCLCVIKSADGWTHYWELSADIGESGLLFEREELEIEYNDRYREGKSFSRTIIVPSLYTAYSRGQFRITDPYQILLLDLCAEYGK